MTTPPWRLHRPRARGTVPAVPIRALCRWALLAGFLVAAAGCSSAITTGAGRDGPAQTAYPPPGGKGPIVVLLSGHSGPDYYQPIAGAVARLGYYAVLFDGKDILTREQDGRGNLSRAIARAQASPHALHGKTVVIGFSQGGGAALDCVLPPCGDERPVDPATPCFGENRAADEKDAAI